MDKEKAVTFVKYFEKFFHLINGGDEHPQTNNCNRNWKRHFNFYLLSSSILLQNPNPVIRKLLNFKKAPDFGLIIVETLKELLKKAITLLTLIYNPILGVSYILYP